jgi:crotonobetainyl-CoA:carnitine CoA-transferase CaiB-like acyl-CoA transferase
MAEYRNILDGYKVLDFSQAVAGPTVTRLMAEMGAEVIKVEIAPVGDPTRLQFLHGGVRSSLFAQHNRGKKSLCLNPKSAAGAEILRALVRKVDVLVENFSPGAIARLGFGYEAVRALNPRIIMCSISAFGQSGPLALKPGFDTIGAAYAGNLDVTGELNGSPNFPGSAVGDVSAGLSATASIGFALLHRERTGKGQYLDISLLDAYFHSHETNVQAYTASRGAIKPTRSGRHSPSYCPCGLYKGKEHYFAIVAPNPWQWEAVCDVIGHPELGKNPDFATNDLRVKKLPLIQELIEGWLASMPSDDDAMRVLDEHHVSAGLVLSVAEAVNHPHLRERGTVTVLNDRILGPFEVPASPMRFSDFPQQPPVDAPWLGEHNAQILRDHLGYSEERIRELQTDGIVHSETR